MDRAGRRTSLRPVLATSGTSAAPLTIFNRCGGGQPLRRKGVLSVAFWKRSVVLSALMALLLGATPLAFPGQQGPLATTSRQIRACVSRTTGAVRIVRDTASCRPTEYAVAWDEGVSPGPTRIFACVNKRTGRPRIVSRRTHCRKSEYRIAWVRGLRGATGPTGPTGPGGGGTVGAQGPTAG